jgi:cell division protein ZapD
MTHEPPDRQLTFFEEETRDPATVGDQATPRGEPRSRSSLDAGRTHRGLSRRGLVALWVLLVVWAGLGYFLFPFERPTQDPAPPDDTVQETELLLVVVQGDEGALPALALFARAPGATRVVLLPATTVVELPGAGPRSLEGALEEAGTQGLTVSVANALGSRVPDALMGGPEQVRDLVDRLGGVEVDVPETIEVEEDGRIQALFTAGPTRMDGAEFLSFATGDIPGQGEIERVARQDAAWRGLLQGLATSGDRGVFEGWEASLSRAGAERFLVATGQTADTEFTTLPVRRVGVTGADLYQIVGEDRERIRALLGEAIAVEEREGYRIRLLVGTDVPVGPAVARELVEAGYVVVLTGRASEPYEETRVVMAENTPEMRERAEELLEFEQPLNERMRTFLRIEFLHRQASFHAEHLEDFSARAAVASLLEMLTVIGRGEVRTELGKELERQAASLGRFRRQPGVVAARLQKLMDKVEGLRARLHEVGSQQMAALKECDFLNNIRHRSAIPGGTCVFDLPDYHYWLHVPVEQRQAQFEQWMSTVQPMYDAVAEVLWLTRQSTEPVERTAECGFYQHTLPRDDQSNLVRVMLPVTNGMFPEISASQHRFNVRFVCWKGVNERPAQTTEDVRFLLALC